MSTPDSQRLVLSDAPEVDVRIEGARSQLRRVLPVKVHDVVLLAKYLDLLVALVHRLGQPHLDALVAAGRCDQASVLVPLRDQNHAVTVEDALDLALVAPDASQPIRSARHHFVTQSLEGCKRVLTFQCTEVMSGSTPVKVQTANPYLWCCLGPCSEAAHPAESRCSGPLPAGSTGTRSCHCP